MTIETQLIESLKTTISVQADLIAQLKLQIESLKSSQNLLVTPSPIPAQPLGTYPPNQQPWGPQSPSTPYPYSPFTYITTSGPSGAGGAVTTTKTFPPGSIQSGQGSNTSAPCTIDFTKIMNHHHDDITGVKSLNLATTSNVVSMYESIIQPTPAPVSTEACNGMS
jgi:hypothetical protein